MATITTFGLQTSASQNGLGVKIVATATPGTVVYTCPSGTSFFDEIWLWVVNRNVASQTVTIEWGDNTVDNRFSLFVPPTNAPIGIVPGWVLNNGKIVYAYSTAANDCTVFGFSRHIEGSWSDQ